MTPFWAIEGEVIPEVANFKEEGLVTPEGWEGEKKLKNCWFTQGIEPGSSGWNARLITTTTLSIGIRRRSFLQIVFYDKSYNFTNPSLPQIEMIDIGHKSLPIIIGPYFWGRRGRRGQTTSKLETMKILLWKVIKTRLFWNFGLCDLENDLQTSAALEAAHWILI